MHKFLHGITRAFLTACGGSLSTCLPLLPFDGGEQEGEADNADLQPQNGQNNSDLQPTRGDADEAVNFDLQPAYKVGHKEEKGDAENSDLQQTLCDEQNKGDLLPTNGDEDVADNLDLQPINLGHQNNNLLLQLTEEGDGKFWPSIGVNSSNGEFFSSLQDYPQFDVMHDWKHYLFAYMHTQIGGFGMAFGVHDEVLITYAKPRVDPKVKKKTSLLLYLTIHSPFHPGEYGHDGSPQHPHHDPYSMILAITLSPQAILMAVHITIMLSLLSVAVTYVFDPGGLSCLHEDVLSACQHTVMTSNRCSSFATAHVYFLDVGGAAKFMVKQQADTLVHANIEVSTGLYTTVSGNQIGYAANYVHQDCMQRGQYSSSTSINDNGQKKVPQVAAAIYNFSLWLNVSKNKEGVDAYFLIPLRGSNSVQWNDEDLAEDVGALKKKTMRRMTVLRLFYLMKDLLDPG